MIEEEDHATWREDDRVGDLENVNAEENVRDQIVGGGDDGSGDTVVSDDERVENMMDVKFRRSKRKKIQPIEEVSVVRLKKIFCDDSGECSGSDFQDEGGDEDSDDEDNEDEEGSGNDDEDDEGR